MYGSFPNLLCKPLYPPKSIKLLSLPDCVPCASRFQFADYSSGIGTCTPCPLQLKSDNEWSSSCDLRSCPVGYLQSDRSCDLCPKGKFGNLSESTNCFSCLPGKYSNELGSSSCTSCKPGSFSSFHDASYCSMCPFGYFSSTFGSSICIACSSGRYLNAENSSSDGMKCPRGTFSAITGASACPNCPPGKSHSMLGATALTDCMSCAPGKYFSLVIDGTECAQCPVGKFIDRVGSTSLSDCLDCVMEASRHSISEGFNCSTWGQEIPYVSSGFYRNNVSDPFDILTCIPNVACLHSENETICAQGYTGSGCSSCMSDFYRNGSLCFACGNSFWRWLLMAFFFFFVILLIWKIISTSPKDVSSSQRIIRQGVKIVISAFQLMATYTRLQGNLTVELLGFFSILDLGNLNVSILGFECGGLLESYWGFWKLKIFAPFAVVSLFLMALLVSGVVEYIRKNSAFSPSLFISTHLPSAVYGYFQIIILFYTLIVSTLLEPFLCSAQVDETFIMQRNPSVQCYSDLWQRNVLPYVVPLGLLYFIVLPFVVLFLLYWNRGKTDLPMFQNYFGFLTKSYRREVYWYEVAVVLKKVLFMTVPEFLALKFSMSMKLFASVLILVFFHIHFQHFQPYSQEILNRLSQQ